MNITLKANLSDANSRLQLTTSQNGTIWLDQVSAMPYDTCKGHGFRSDLIEMISRLRPRFLKFPGGRYVEGFFLNNAFRWKDTVGPWQKRPGHASYWGYWSDDALGFLEYLQLAEDLGAEPVWVVNSGISMRDEVDTSLIAPFVQETLDGVEFARGSVNSRWGSLRAKLGHPTLFSMRFIAIGSENCGSEVYKGNYVKFHSALKSAYPDVKVISNCNGLEKPLDHPADLYDVKVHGDILGMVDLFEKKRRDPRAPKAVVTQYSVDTQANFQFETYKEGLAEAALLLSLEQNSDIVDMVSCFPPLVNQNDKSWSPGAIYFNSNRVYGVASYWVQTFFNETSGAVLMKTDIDNQEKLSNVYITAIKWTDWQHNKYIRIKVVNHNTFPSKLKLFFDGFAPNSTTLKRKTEFVSNNLVDNTFENATKVVPVSSLLDEKVGRFIDCVVQPFSLTSYDIMHA